MDIKLQQTRKTGKPSLNQVSHNKLLSHYMSSNLPRILIRDASYTQETLARESLSSLETPPARESLSTSRSTLSSRASSSPPPSRLVNPSPSRSLDPAKISPPQEKYLPKVQTQPRKPHHPANPHRRAHRNTSPTQEIPAVAQNHGFHPSSRGLRVKQMPRRNRLARRGNCCIKDIIFGARGGGRVRRKHC